MTRARTTVATTQSSSTALFGKKKKTGGGGGGYSSSSQQPQQEKKSVQEARFDANTRQFMFTLSRLSKILPDKSKKILDDINLSFYPGAKIGVVGLNGSGYVKHHNIVVCACTAVSVGSLASSDLEDEGDWGFVITVPDHDSSSL